MNPLWSKVARELSPYVPGEQPRVADLVKLNTNENPFGPSPKALEAMRAAAADSLRLYPDPEATDLRDALATHHGVTPDQVFVGNGSDEVLAHAFVALLKQSKPLLYPDITYSFYPVWAQLFDVDVETVPLDAELRVRVDDYRRDAGSIIFPNPNAPTGMALPRTEIERLLDAHADIPVLIDEAYIDFGGESAVPAIADRPNLLIVRTMSKARGLAGLRVGYALGDAGLIEALTRVKDSFNSYPLGTVAQAGAAASVRDETYFMECCARIIGGREAMTQALVERGFVVLPSSANFIFAQHPDRDGPELASELRARAVLVRHFNKPRTAPYLRITVGTEEDTARLIAAVDDI
ncbi:MAG: histidinol-phosphate transaminase, partial [Pseudomonadota bacterium]|nr:histidinol-phosphate transaminase [Pseudomonadota bacterium]